MYLAHKNTLPQSIEFVLCQVWRQNWTHLHNQWFCISEGTVTLSDCKLFSACLHEAKPLTLRRAAIDNLPRFGVNPANVTESTRFAAAPLVNC